MELYTLGSNFVYKDLLQEKSSVIWTERYTSAGDVTLVVQDTPTNDAMLPEGTFLATPGSKEVMLLETKSYKDGFITLTGNSLLGFLQQRLAWFGDVYIDSESVTHREENGFATELYPELALRTLIEKTCVSPDATWGNMQLDWVQEVIPNLITTPISELTYEHGIADLAYSPDTVYAVATAIAETYSIGINLVLEAAGADGYILKFNIFNGVDRTSDQTTRDLVRFSPKLGSLDSIEELRSMTEYKNICYAYAKDFLLEVAYEHTPPPIPVGFDRRVMIVTLDDVPTDATAAQVSALLTQLAKNALANHNYVRMVDGEVGPQSEFQFGTHYKLGDIIELEGRSGQLQKARVTEHIRSEDDTGERAYPTITVIDD